jgi:hypothetical protein
MRRLTIILLLFFVMPIHAKSDEFCVTLYYASGEREIWEDVTITRFETVTPPDYTLSGEDVTWIDANFDGADIFHPPQRVSLTDPTVENYIAYLVEHHTGAETFAPIYLYNRQTQLIARLLKGVSGAAEWSGDGRLFLAWRADENRDWVADDDDVRLAIYTPEQGITQEVSFTLDGYDEFQSRGWSADARTIALLNDGSPYRLRDDRADFYEGRILLIDSSTLQPVAELDSVSGFRWSPQGNTFAYITGGTLVIGQPQDIEQQTYELSPDEVYYFLPEWSDDGRYVVVNELPYYGEQVLYHLIDSATQSAILLEAQSNGYNDSVRRFNRWSQDGKRWLYLEDMPDGTFSIKVFDVTTSESQTLAEHALASTNHGYFGVVYSQGDIFYVAQVHNVLTLSSVHDDGSNPRIIFDVPDDEVLVRFQVTETGEHLVVMTAELPDDDSQEYRSMTVTWFNRAGEFIGNVSREFVKVAEIETNPVPAMLLQTRSGLQFEALYVNLNEANAISILMLDESEGAPYGYWNANWWMESSPAGEYTWLRFEQPYPIWYEGQFLVAPYGAAVGENVHYGEWSPDGSLLLTREDIFIQGEQWWDRTTTNIILRIATPDGTVLWEYDIPVERGLYKYFWSDCEAVLERRHP